MSVLIFKGKPSRSEFSSVGEKARKVLMLEFCDHSGI